MAHIFGINIFETSDANNRYLKDTLLAKNICLDVAHIDFYGLPGRTHKFGSNGYMITQDGHPQYLTGLEEDTFQLLQTMFLSLQVPVARPNVSTSTQHLTCTVATKFTPAHASWRGNDFRT
jgi:hypothetical protein